MKVGMIALTAALVMLAAPAWAGPPDPCIANPTDTDSDTICDAADNCSGLASAFTCDTDSDGYGNPCDGDFNSNNVTSIADFTVLFLPDLVSGSDTGIGSDMNCGGTVSISDFTILFIPQLIKGFPGPSGIACAGTTPCP